MSSIDSARSRAITQVLRPHDLLQIDVEPFIAIAAADRSVPGWVADQLRLSSYVVVRRGSRNRRHIPIGVRGLKRHQRWAAFCHPRWIRRVNTPPELLEWPIPESRMESAPALHALSTLRDRWKHLGLPWGPGGSVGFELATGVAAVTPDSDLDIVIYVDRPILAKQASMLCEQAMNLPAAVDIRAETPICGFSLREYATRSPASILLRLPGQMVLGSDPWAHAGAGPCSVGSH